MHKDNKLKHASFLLRTMETLPVIGFTKTQAMYDLGLWLYEHYYLVSKLLEHTAIRLMTDESNDALLKALMEDIREEYKWGMEGEEDE